jgi:hypothetical protein
LSGGDSAEEVIAIADNDEDWEVDVFFVLIWLRGSADHGGGGGSVFQDAGEFADVDEVLVHS